MNAHLQNLKMKLARVGQTQWIVAGAIAFIAAAVVGGKLTARRSARAVSSVAAVKVDYPANKVDQLSLLDSAQLTDPDAAMMVARPAASLSGDLKKLAGEYNVQLKSRVSTDVVAVKARIRTESSKKGVVATMSGELTEGDKHRKFTVEGALKLAPTPSTKPASYLMQVGSRAYWQLFYVAKSDQWYANYYDRDSSGHYVNQGVAQLSR